MKYVDALNLNYDGLSVEFYRSFTLQLGIDYLDPGITFSTIFLNFPDCRELSILNYELLGEKQKKLLYNFLGSLQNYGYTCTIESNPKGDVKVYNIIRQVKTLDGSEFELLIKELLELL